MKPRTEERRLTMRERRFVEVFRGNATEAATTAGYKPSSARKIGSRLLAKPVIRQELNRQMALVARNVGVERADVLGRLWQLASLAPSETGNNITGQVRAADALADILGMKVQRTADLTKQFEGRTEEELEFFAQHGYWPDSVDTAKSGASRAQGNSAPVPDPK